ncbi:hypothetical protein Poli38472_002849 [Pythium oligandrum]|uniref:Vacuolar protein sorting-associated protein 8 central domain-containing protein n=1 Tax=Pythium oligandrum TaxID=41045 RepID=A0A8K1FDH6_PYTOL|nr:hypothetical protein Poli38472_002849 [Pythium oligandrum]|eukprot:TMW56924.1 hypothetical protein Poli38472_002849 [Pythium oligandrum]
MSIRTPVESLLLQDSDDEDLGDVDLASITLEEILREEEAAEDGPASPTGEDEFFSPATMTMALTPMPGMEVVNAPVKARSGSLHIDRKKSVTEIGVGGHAGLLSAASSDKLNGAMRSPLEIAEARERQLLSCVGVELVSPLQVKRRLRSNARTKSATKRKPANRPKSKKKITLASLNADANGKDEKKSTGVVKVEAMETISRQLKKNIEFKEHGPGSPTVVAIHSKFIAIGTSKGLVLIFDHFQNIRQVLGNTNDSDSDGAITAIDVSPGSDYLVCGYQSGRIVLWDMIKGTSLKAVSDAHENPVVSLRFLKDQKPVLMSVDTNGIVNKVNFSKMMGMVYVVDVDPIYDGSAGRILSLSILPQSAGNAKISHLTDQYCLAALSSEKVTFIIAIEPEVKILHRWMRPEEIGADDPVLPSLAFAWISFPGSSRALAPVLARGWGKHVQFLEVVFPGGQNHSHSKHGWPTFEEHDQIESSSDTMAIQWLGDQVVVYLNSHDEICVYDVMSRQELEIVDVSSLELVFASYRGKNARSFSNSFRGCDNILYLLGLKELQTARVQPWTQRIDTLVEEGQWLEALALALDHYEGLKVAAADRAVRDRFPPVFFRDRQNDQCLVDLLHMCQTNQRTGEKEDVFRHEDGDEVRWRCGEDPYPIEISKKLEETYQKARSGQVTKNFVPISVAERVADLLMEYVRLAIANAPSSTATTTSSGPSWAKNNLKLDLAKSHYQMLAGVCIEFCAIINRTDLLFGEIFKRFKDAGKTDIFVELLEPYILADRLRSLSPEVMQAFVTHYSVTDKLPQVEQCLLHLNVTELDIDTMVKLCKEHELYSALVYIYNEGLHDYVAPIDILLEAATTEKNKPSSRTSSAASSAEPSPAKPPPAVGGSKVSNLAAAFGGSTRGITTPARTLSTTRKPSASSSSENVLTGARRRRLYGYKLLLYISYSLSGRSFPKHELLAPQLVNKVRAEILHHLFEKNVEGNKTLSPRLMALVELDAKEFFNVLARVFDDPTVEFEGEKKEASSRMTSRYETARQAGLAKCPSRLSMVLALAEVVVGPAGDISSSPFSSVEHGHFFMFEARLLSGGSIDAQDYADARGAALGKGGSVGAMMNSLMNFLALGPASLSGRDNAAATAAAQEEGFDKNGREAMLVRLLQKLRKDYYDHDALLQSVKTEGMHRAAVILYKEKGDISQAIASYLADAEHDTRMNVFNYIRVETDKLVDEDGDNSADTAARRKVIEDAVLTHAGPLMETDDHSFVVLIIGQFPNLNNKVIQKFLSMGKSGAKLEFVYLKQMLKGSSNKTDVADEGDVVKELLDRSKLRLADDPAVQERFVRLLCEFEPEGVFPYLESHDSYKVDACLKLCKDFSITDAEAYLLERTGDVTGALTLILQSLEQKLKILKPALRGYNMTSTTDGLVGGASALSRTQVADSIIDSLSEGREAKQTLEVALVMCQRNSLRNRDEQSQKLWFTLLDKLLRIQNAVKRAQAAKPAPSSSSSTTRITTRSGGSGAQTAFQVALNELIRIILERMASSVSLKSILFKITNEHGRGQFGDFRPTIFGMLDTYNYEQNIYQTANGLISADLYEQVTTLKRALARAYAPPSDTCGYCKVSLAKPPFGMAHSGASGGEKWNVSTSMVMVVSRQAFHESCAKAWQQDVDASATTTRSRPALQRQANAMGLDRVPDRGGSVSTASEVGLDDDASLKLQRNKPSTRRYLNRLKNARKSTRRPVSLHVVLESLIREDNGRNKYLKSSRAVYSLRPDPEQANKVKKRIGTRTPGSLPVNPIQRGSIMS